MIKHFAGELGYNNTFCSFEYDDSIFKIVDNGELVCIYIGEGERDILKKL